MMMHMPSMTVPVIKTGFLMAIGLRRKYKANGNAMAISSNATMRQRKKICTPINVVKNSIVSLASLSKMFDIISGVIEEPKNS